MNSVVEVNVNTSDFYETTNEHGYPQTMQCDPKGDIPVCSQCKSVVMPNRGSGTCCEWCQHEAMLEMSHDYDVGGVFA